MPVPGRESTKLPVYCTGATGEGVATNASSPVAHAMLWVEVAGAASQPSQVMISQDAAAAMFAG